LHAQVPAGATRIKHIVFILKENHTFDNYFGSLPGVDGASSGRIHSGRSVPLTRAPDTPNGDILHSWHYAVLAMDRGKMDKFDLIPGARQYGLLYSYTQYQADQLPSYFAYARQFVLADEFFTSVHGPSFPNHLYTIAAQAGGAMDNPIFGVSDSTGPWGCDSPQATRVPVLAANGRKSLVYPCFDFQTVADSLGSEGLSWRYYGVPYGTDGYVWCAFDAIKHIRLGPLWNTNVVDNSQFVSDAAADALPSVSWITTDLADSEHPVEEPCIGENSTVGFVNAVMESPAWNSTVIFVSWDDFGGFYDTAPPKSMHGGLDPGLVCSSSLRSQSGDTSSTRRSNSPVSSSSSRSFFTCHF